MARGYIYEITDSPSLYPLGYMTPDDLYTSDNHEFEYVETSTLNESQIEETLKQYGIICTHSTDDETGINVLTFTMTQEIKNAYFQPRLTAIQNLVKDTTVQDYLDKGIQHQLQMLLNDTYGDAVYHNSSFYTFDSFMYSAEPGKTYQIGNVCYMH